jgi:drug/metabolite transporter (DMT)-like permease
MKLAPGVASALGAAAIFGAATPFAKRVGEGVNPQVFAGLLYFGSGAILSMSLAARSSGQKEARLQRVDLVPLLLAVVFGGMAGPLLLMIGLRTTSAASASLLLNLEAVFTALGAWLIVKEHADRRIVVGMIVIVAAASLLSIDPAGGFRLTVGALAIGGACLCWGIDNVATRPLALRDPRQVAATKGLVAGTANISIGLATGGHLPSTSRISAAMLIGFVGYGMSLVLYVRAMRSLGTARTGAYYAAAPFVGSAIALIWLREPVGRFFVPALALMAVGLAIHLTERHVHEHAHVAAQHAHRHDHVDAHHDHREHDGMAVDEHGTVHAHEPIVHDHGHTPDEHHLHDHDHS